MVSSLSSVDTTLRRGQSLARKVMHRVLELAKEKGYKKMRLDSVERLDVAIKLYDSMGFKRIPAYVYNPEPDVVFMEYTIQ